MPRMGSLYIFTIAHHSLPGVVIKTDGVPFLNLGCYLEKGSVCICAAEYKALEFLSGLILGANMP